MRIPPTRIGAVHILQEPEFSGTQVFGVGFESLAGVLLPILFCLRAVADRLQPLGVLLEASFKERSVSPLKRFAPNIDHLSPHMLALLGAQRLAHFLGKVSVVLLRQAWADHPEGPVAFILKPMETFNSLGNQSRALLEGLDKIVVKRPR